jgi:hypothetical protein
MRSQVWRWLGRRSLIDHGCSPGGAHRPPLLLRHDLRLPHSCGRAAVRQCPSPSDRAAGRPTSPLCPPMSVSSSSRRRASDARHRFRCTKVKGANQGLGVPRVEVGKARIFSCASAETLQRAGFMLASMKKLFCVPLWHCCVKSSFLSYSLSFAKGTPMCCNLPIYILEIGLYLLLQLGHCICGSLFHFLSEI